MTPLMLERTLTELDHVRISHLVQRAGPDRLAPPVVREVGDLLDAAQIVPSRKVDPDVVTMYSQVHLRDLATGTLSKLTLVYPDDAEPAAGFVSVLSPVGRGLLGLRVGEVARWAAPGGPEHAAEVVALLFQPESSGDYTL